MQKRARYSTDFEITNVDKDQVNLYTYHGFDQENTLVPIQGTLSQALRQAYFIKFKYFVNNHIHVDDFYPGYFYYMKSFYDKYVEMHPPSNSYFQGIYANFYKSLNAYVRYDEYVINKPDAKNINFLYSKYFEEFMDLNPDIDIELYDIRSMGDLNMIEVDCLLVPLKIFLKEIFDRILTDKSDEWILYQIYNQNEDENDEEPDERIPQKLYVIDLTTNVATLIEPPKMINRLSMDEDD